jgi:hypothetical protein
MIQSVRTAYSNAPPGRKWMPHTIGTRAACPRVVRSGGRRCAAVACGGRCGSRHRSGCGSGAGRHGRSWRVSVDQRLPVVLDVPPVTVRALPLEVNRAEVLLDQVVQRAWSAIGGVRGSDRGTRTAFSVCRRGPDHSVRAPARARTDGVGPASRRARTVQYVSVSLPPCRPFPRAYPASRRSSETSA